MIVGTAEVAPYGSEDVTPLGDIRIRFKTAHGHITVSVNPDTGRLEISAEDGLLEVAPRAANLISVEVKR